MKKKRKIKPLHDFYKNFENKSNSITVYENDFILRKKELILLDYQSLFDVYTREFNIVYSFRGWAITLLTAYFGILLATKIPLNGLIHFPGVFIILSFYILEVAERSVMKRLLEEVRSLEKIFMLQSNEEFGKAVSEYIFRDLRDVNVPRKKKINNFLISLIHPQVIVWNTILITEYLILVYILPILIK